MVGSKQYVPDAGDVVWISFNPQSGHGQAGRRPALVLSPIAYNRKVGLALLCPITSQVKGYPFEVHLPDGLPAKGVILADQVKNLDWKTRHVEPMGNVPTAVVDEVLAKLMTLLQISDSR